jgi:hypothetical protein
MYLQQSFITWVVLMGQNQFNFCLCVLLRNINEELMNNLLWHATFASLYSIFPKLWNGFLVTIAMWVKDPPVTIGMVTKWNVVTNCQITQLYSSFIPLGCSGVWGWSFNVVFYASHLVLFCDFRNKNYRAGAPSNTVYNINNNAKPSKSSLFSTHHIVIHKDI